MNTENSDRRRERSRYLAIEVDGLLPQGLVAVRGTVGILAPVTACDCQEA